MNFPHTCLICLTPFRTKFGFCPDCAQELYARRDPKVRDDRKLNVRSLFAWRKDGIFALRWLSASLKHKQNPEPWRELAVWMVDAHRPERAPRVLVPVPGSSKKGNHALGFARAVSEITGWPVLDALEFARDGGLQKRLSRLLRQKREFRLTEKTRLEGEAPESVGTKYTPVVIIDDIVTTGATARAAYHALNRPRNCEVWCILDRRPCGEDTPLL